ncbi:MAG TPA: hypothetical protein VK875_00200 [Euzebyales bacterium]|nr:hypothetical protein [Euzebyales bacterium]
MKFRFGLIIGLAAGYVLGARAGYERYQQIQSAWRSVRRSEPAQRFGAEARNFADRASTRLEETATRGVDQISESLRSSSSPASGSGASSEMDRMRMGRMRY